MEAMGKLSVIEQMIAQLMGYKPFEKGEVTKYIPMTQEERDKNSIVLERLARKIYLKYVGRDIPEGMKFGFIKRTARNIKSTGLCICERKDGKMIPREIKVEEELFFHPKEMIAVLKHELAHLYQIEEIGKTRHGKSFKTLIHTKFNLSFERIEENPKSLEKRLFHTRNLEILRYIKIRKGMFS